MSRRSGRNTKNALYVAHYIAKNSNRCVTMISSNEKRAKEKLELIKEQYDKIHQRTTQLVYFDEMN